MSLDFVASTSDAAETMTLAQEPIVLCGHTHQAAYFEARTGLTDELVAVEHAIKLDVEYELPASARVCLNPGAGCDAAGAGWLALTFDGELRLAAWHRTGVRGHGRKLPPSP
jgi:hypothetical protein